MNNKLNILLVLCLAIVFYQCDNKGTAAVGGNSSNTSAEASVSGTISGVPEGTTDVFLDRMSLNASMVLGKAPIDGSGNFSVPIEKFEPGIYRLRIKGAKAFLVLGENDKAASVKADFNSIVHHNYEVAGSKASTTYLDLMRKNVGGSLTEDELKEFLTNEEESISAMYVAYRLLKPNGNIDMFKDINSRLAKQYPSSSYSNDFSSFVSNIQANIQKQNIQIGGTAPDITLPGPDGKQRSLHDLRGQVVLLDFWASWCRPCRRENPNVVAMYKKYKNKGFTVFNVSLDKQMERWAQAIEKDGLEWDGHVSDLKGWSAAPAKLYGVSGIPKTFLLDKEGKIVAMNPRGPQLEAELKKLFGS